MSEDVRLRQDARCFQSPVLTSGIWQLLTSFGGFFASCGIMYLLSGVSYWLALALVPLAAGFLVRIFIIQHDCGHSSFFGGRRANDAFGFLCSLVTLTPYPSWRRQHAGHHGVWNDLDRRDNGADIYSPCLTVAEYQALPLYHRLFYRVTRHPLVANILLPPIVILGLFRLPFDTPRSWRRERRAVHVTNLCLIGVFAGLGLVLGFGEVAIVQLPIIAVASIIGVWLFSVQHRSDNTVWVRSSNWDAVSASMKSTTFLRLPAVLRWFTGNIGYHHVHHLNPRIPNYRLRECHDAMPALHTVPTLSFWQSIRAVRLVLWDEAHERMVTFREAGRRPERN